LHFPLYFLTHFSNDEQLISHVETLVLANNDLEEFKHAKKVSENKKNNDEIDYMEYLLSVLIIG
jgi:hypothetical protein